MPFTHHSHSGQFCPGHAQNSLEEVLQTAISKRMQVFAMTEHMPRHEVDFYEEEVEAQTTFDWHLKNEADYYHEAIRLRNKYQGQIQIPIGFESDWIRAESQALIERSLKEHAFDFFVGSVHHVHTVPIDYSQELYANAKEIAGGTDERLFENYFDAQYAMLEAVTPPVVGHLDLIRLKSDDANASFKKYRGVWQRVLRNLDFIAAYGGIVELNSASLRKGMSEPYPKAEICKASQTGAAQAYTNTIQEFLARRGRFCLSDDSHGISQVALNYRKILPFLKEVGVSNIHFLDHATDAVRPVLDHRFPSLVIGSMSISELEQHPFWSV